MTAAWRRLSLASRSDMLERARQILDLLASAGQRGVGHEVVVGRKRSLSVPSGRTMIGALGVEEPALSLVIEIGDHDLLQHLLMDGRVLHRHHNLDTA